MDTIEDSLAAEFSFNEAPAERGGKCVVANGRIVVADASMRPPQNAGESTHPYHDEERGSVASMRPPQNAGESDGVGVAIEQHRRLQ